MGFFGKGTGGQVALDDSVETLLYTCPDSYSLDTSVTLTETSGADHTFRIAVVRAGEILGTKHYIVYDGELPANSVRGVKGLSVNQGEEVWVYVAGGANEDVAACIFIDAVKPQLA